MKLTDTRFAPPVYSYYPVTNTETGETYTVLCDYRGVFSIPRKEVERFIQELRDGLDHLSDADLLEADKYALLQDAPGMFPQVYGANDALWRQYLREHPPQPAGPLERKRRPQPSGYVYVIRMGQFYKIGCSKTPDKRVDALRVKSPEPLHVLFLIPAADMFKAEQELHERFASCRAEGEWFRLTEQDLLVLQGLYPTRGTV